MDFESDIFKPLWEDHSWIYSQKGFKTKGEVIYRRSFIQIPNKVGQREMLCGTPFISVMRGDCVRNSDRECSVSQEIKNKE